MMARLCNGPNSRKTFAVSTRCSSCRPTFARVFYLIRIQELHEHLEGLSLSLSDGHFQQRLQAAQFDIPTNAILLARRVPLIFNVLL